MTRGGDAGNSLQRASSNRYIVPDAGAKNQIEAPAPPREPPASHKPPDMGTSWPLQVILRLLVLPPTPPSCARTRHRVEQAAETTPPSMTAEQGPSAAPALPTAARSGHPCIEPHACPGSSPEDICRVWPADGPKSARWAALLPRLAGRCPPTRPLERPPSVGSRHA